MFPRLSIARCLAFVTATLLTVRAALGAVAISGVEATNVGTTTFTMVWTTSEVSTPGLDVFSDSAGTTNVTAALQLDFFPLHEGDYGVVNDAAARTGRRALELLSVNRRVVAVRITGAAPGTNYHVRPRTFDSGGTDNSTGPVGLTTVKTAQFTSFVLQGRLLAVRFPGGNVEGNLVLVHGPPGTSPLAAVIGDSAPADTAVFDLANFVDGATGTNPLLATPQNLLITVLGAGAPAGSFTRSVDFANGFATGGYDLFETGAASPAPVITAHPADATVLVGQSATFSVAASGDPAPGYQWQRQAVGSGTWTNVTNVAPYSGATTASLSVASVTQGMSGDQFRAIASNGVPPDATSNAATLNVTVGSSSIALSNLAQVYDGTPKSVTVTTTPAGLANSVTYNGSATPPTNAGSYAVVATITAAGYSGSTNGTLVIAKAAQTITFDPLANRTFGNAPFPVAATASSGLPVAFDVVSGAATIAGDTITLTGAGSVTVRATQAGNGNFNAAPAVERSFNVGKAAGSVTLGNLSQVYTATPRAASATTFPGGMSVTFTYNGLGTAPTNVGSYNVVATILHADYEGSTTGTLTITKAPLIARADNKTKVEGTPNPALTVTYLGFLGGQNASVLDLEALASTTATTASPPGTYPITLSEAFDDTYEVTLQSGTLTITPAATDSPPVINVHPQSRTVTVGAPVTFTVEATGSATLAYQWFKNGAVIGGATTASHAIASAALGDAGSYSVRVSNAFGFAVSQLASLTVKPLPNVPTITDQPDDLTVRRRARATFRVSAVGDAPLSYQWRKGTTPIGGATARTYVIEDVELADAGLYSVVVTNPAGTATSRGATLTVAGRSWRGTYFGHFGNNGGTCAFYIRDDNTGIFCGYARGSNIPLFTRDCRVDDDGHFRFTSGPRRVTLPPGTAAADPVYDFDLVIAEDGSVTGTVSGLNLTVQAALSPTGGATENIAGFYEAGAPNSSDVTYTIVGSSGEAYVVAIVGTQADAGLGTASAAGNVDVITENNAVVDASVNAAASTITSTITPAAGAPVSFAGANNDVREDVEKLINISTRGPTETGDNIMIAGFVVSGTQPKQVLIRGIGPTLARYNVPGVLPAVGLRLYSGQTELASAGDWGAASNAAEIAAAAARVLAFDLPFDSHDSAMLITLQPGAYTAHVFGPNGETGVSLAEVYDATEGPIAPDQRVINISTRGIVGTGDDVQIAGFVVSGTVPRRVLIRGVGPTLGGYGVPGTLDDPVITLYDVGGSAITSNDDWGSGGNAATIAEVSARVQAFALNPGSKDAVLLLNLEPGVYTVHLRGASGTTGVALVEVYDAP